MRNMIMSAIIGLGLMVGFSSEIGINSEVMANEVSVNINAEVEYQPDGDVVITYSDGSCILYNDDEYEYTMWIPEVEDYEHNYDSYEDLMYAIDHYHNMHNRVVTDIEYTNDEHRSVLNPYGFTAVAEELDKIEEISGAEFIDLIDRTGLEIIYSSAIIEEHEDDMNLADDRMVLGYYNRATNRIVMRQDYRSIDKALIHELGHCIDNQLGLRYNDTIIDSYMNNEVSFTDESNSGYYYSSIAEYIAESISEYYNGTLDEDTVMYQELDSILGK